MLNRPPYEGSWLFVLTGAFVVALTVATTIKPGETTEYF